MLDHHVQIVKLYDFACRPDEKFVLGSCFVRICLVPFPVMITRPAGHNAEARKSEDEAEAQNFF